MGAIIPNLLTADRSVLCIDSKGENARASIEARQRFDPVDMLGPFGVTGAPNAAFNPLAGLDEGSSDLVEDAMLLADALVYNPPGLTSEAHCNEEAKALIAGLIMYVALHENPDIKHLMAVRELLTRPPDDFGSPLSLMQKSRHGDGLIARAANRHLGKSAARRPACGSGALS